MKYAALILFLVGINGMASAQERKVAAPKQKMKVTTTLKSTSAKPASEATPATMKQYRNVKGTVRTASCGTYIEVLVDGQVRRYFPTNLNRKMHTDGYTLLFDYVDDKTQSFPENCDIIKAIQVNNVRNNIQR